MKGAGMLVGNYELKETTPGVAQFFFCFFLSLKAIFLNFDYMNLVNKTNWKYIFFFNIPSSATLKETFTAKYNGVLPRTP